MQSRILLETYQKEYFPSSSYIPPPPFFAMPSPEQPALVFTSSTFFPCNEINIFTTMWNDSKTDSIALFSDNEGRFYSKELRI